MNRIYQRVFGRLLQRIFDVYLNPNLFTALILARITYMPSQFGVATSPASKGSKLMPFRSEPKSLSLLSQYIVLKSCWSSLILNCLGSEQTLLIAFILSYLVTINLMSFF